jgi:hypothetical protein|nr:MAG TPA: ribosomal protein S12 methylthiotransferase [Bacteriophage sp.]
MKIGIVDADLVGRKKHRFPNLACEKISGYHKRLGHEVHLLTTFEWPDTYDRIYISKVFTDTPVPDFVNDLAQSNPHSKIRIGGTGFYFDKAPALPDEIEHHMPDYHLYDEWIEQEVQTAKRKAQQQDKRFDERRFMANQFKFYTDYSLGFITRGCFRKCGFCVNQKYNHVFEHSPLKEFMDDSRKKLCFLDDNFLGYPRWKRLLQEIIDTGKPFVFKQALDERILTDEKCKMLFSAKYDGDMTFAFDNIKDYDLIHRQLEIIKKYKRKKNVKFYVLVGFESTDAEDIENAFKRIELLFRYGCFPYTMRYMGRDNVPYMHSKYRALYVALAGWTNQPRFIKRTSFRQFCELEQERHKNKETLCSSMQALNDFEREHPDIAKRYFDMHFIPTE